MKPEILFGIITCLLLTTFCVFSKNAIRIFSKNGFISWLMLILACVVAVSTYMPPGFAGKYFGTDIIHSYLFTGLCGVLGAGLIISLWQLGINLKKPRSLPVAFIHLGAIVFLLGTGITSNYGVQGILNMHIGDTVSTFYVTEKNNLLSGYYSMPAKMNLVDFETEYYPVQYELRVYQDDKGKYNLIQRLNSDEKERKFSVDGITIQITDFFPDFSVEYDVREESENIANAISALFLSINDAEKTKKEWLFATEQKNGWLEGNGFRVLLTKDSLKDAINSLLSFKSAAIPSGTPAIFAVYSAQEKNYGIISLRNKTSEIFPISELPLTIEIAGNKIIFEIFHSSSSVKVMYKTLSDSLKNPAVEVSIRKENYPAEKNLLVASEPASLPLGNDKYLIYQKVSPQPKSFKSTVGVIPENGSYYTHEILVNHPLSVGEYKIYQADFSGEDPTFSGMNVTYDPGKPVVITGLITVLCGTVLLLFISPMRNKTMA